LLQDYVATATTTTPKPTQDVHYALTTYVKPKIQVFLPAISTNTDPILFFKVEGCKIV